MALSASDNHDNSFACHWALYPTFREGELEFKQQHKWIHTLFLVDTWALGSQVHFDIQYGHADFLVSAEDHAVLFYSSIDVKRELVFPFLQEAFETQGTAIYVSEHEPLDELREAMKHWGIYVDKYESERSLKITDFETLKTAEEQLYALKANKLLDDLLQRLMKQRGPVRVVADPTLLVKHGMVDAVAHRERTLGRRLELPLTMICCYEDTLADAKEGEFLVETLRAHSHAVFPGLALELA